MRLLNKLFSAVICLTLVAGALADTKVIEKIHTDAASIMGQSQPATDQENTVWFGDGVMRSDNGKRSLIVRTRDNKLVLVDHTKKTYAEADLPLDLSKIMPAAMFEQMKKMMAMEITVTPTGETRKIGEWNCLGYDMILKLGMMNLTSKVWASEEVSAPADARKAIGTVMFATQSDGAAMVAEFSKIKGYRVLQESTVNIMGATVASREELVSAETATAPSGHYAPPAGYTPIPFTMESLQSMN